jgi:signal transduction histidine kinase
VPSQTARYLRSIGVSGRHLLSVVDDILDFSKLNATKMTLSLEDLSVAQLLGEVKETIEPIARQANITLDFPTAAAR